MQKRNDIVVCGLGNPLLGDEGIGIYLIQELTSKYNHDVTIKRGAGDLLTGAIGGVPRSKSPKDWGAGGLKKASDSTVNYLHHVDFVEAGSSLMSVVHAIAGRQKAVLIDCALMKEPPGTIIRFTPDEVSSIKNLAHFSLHEGDLLGALELSRNLGECPEIVVIFGIQPESIEPGEGLSPTLIERMSNYIEVISSELQESLAYND